MAYQDALALYNGGKIEEAYEELKNCSPTPMVDGLRKECEKQIEEQYFFFIKHALKENPQNPNALSLYNQYANKYGPSERLKAILPNLATSNSSTLNSPQENSKNKSSTFAIYAIGTALAVCCIGILFYVKSNSSGDSIDANWSDDGAVAEIDSIYLEDVQPETATATEEIYLIYHNSQLVPLDEKYLTGRVVVNESGEVLGNYLGEDTDNYMIETNDSYTAPKSGLHVETFRARDGQGEIVIRGLKAPVYRNPNTSDFLCTIENEEGMMPDGYKCLGYNNGWFHISLFDGRDGFVESSKVEWYTIWW